jgi:drug/metabolite transporter (DMT)-like permease
MFGLASAVAAFVIWALSATVLLRGIPLPAPIITWFGFLVGAVSLFALIFRRRAAELRLAKERYLPKLILLGIAFAGISLCYQSAVKATTIANAILTHSTQAVLTCAVFVPLFLRKRVPKMGLVALFLGLAGLVALLAPQLSWRGSSWGNTCGIALGLLSAVFYAWFNVQVPSYEGRLPQEVVLAYLLAIASVVLFPFALLSWEPTLAFHGSTIAKLVLFGLLNNTLANALYYYALRKAPMDRVTALSYLEPAVAIVFAAMFLNEPVGPSALLDGGMILASSGIAVFRGKPQVQIYA